MTHSFFAEMGGFAYRDSDGENGLQTIGFSEFLNLCRTNEIANPVIMFKEIKDKGKSDGIGKAILAIQLLWRCSSLHWSCGHTGRTRHALHGCTHPYASFLLAGEATLP